MSDMELTFTQDFHAYFDGRDDDTMQLEISQSGENTKIEITGLHGHVSVTIDEWEYICQKVAQYQKSLQTMNGAKN